MHRSFFSSLQRLLRESSVTLHTCKEEGRVHLVKVERCDDRLPSQPTNSHYCQLSTREHCFSHWHSSLTCKWCGRSGGSTRAYWSSAAPWRTDAVPHGSCVPPLEPGSACRTDSSESQLLSVNEQFKSWSWICFTDLNVTRKNTWHIYYTYIPRKRIGAIKRDLGLLTSSFFLQTTKTLVWLSVSCNRR